MQKTFFFLTAILLLFPVSYSFAFQTKGQECSKCHTLKKEEASALLKDLIQNPKILDIKTVPVKSIWEVVLESNGKKGIVYIYFSKKHLFSGAIIGIQGKKNLTQDRLVELNKVNVSQIPLKDALVIGDRSAQHKVIVFDDPD